MSALGIDLGTTNSCVFLVTPAGHRPVSDRHGNATIPSVVFAAGAEAPEVGLVAKNRIGMNPGPILAIKRRMGSTETVMLGGEERTPVEVSAIILRHLKDLADAELAEPADRVVVTVPAYFSHVQRRQTDEAARLAGFREVVTLLEPVAAALAYALDSERDNLRIFVYDMGGGTFDATVLERDSDGGLTVLSFGGDPFLGGDDIDSRLAERIRSRLAGQGYDLELHLDDPAHRSRFDRLKSLAEFAKRELSTEDRCTLSYQGIFQDNQGVTVDLETTLTRADVEDCARDLVERSIDASVETLAARSVPVETVDEVIMVGGMSRMPLIRQRLEEVFGRAPRLADPDLIVARGAAIKAAEVFGDRVTAESGLRLELQYDRRTSHLTARVSAVLDRELDRHAAYLVSDSTEYEQALDGVDRFIFDGVRLQPGRPNEFTLSIEDAAENVVLHRTFTITHDFRAPVTATSPGSVVTRAISVRTVDGLHVLLAENTPLPITRSRTFTTTDQSGRIVVPIHEGDHEVSRLVIDDLPTDLRIGTNVVVVAEIGADYAIHARARVAGQDREAAVRFSIEPVDVSHVTPDWVQARLEELRHECLEAQARCARDTDRESLRLRAQLLIDEIELELAEPEPKRLRLSEKIGSLRFLTDSAAGDGPDPVLSPSFSEFSTRLASLLEDAAEADHPNLRLAQENAEKLRAAARTAWEQRDPFAWNHANRQIDGIAGLLRPQLEPREMALGMAAWLLRSQLPELLDRAPGEAASIAAIEGAALDIFLKTQLGVMPPHKAVDSLVSLYRSQVVPLRRAAGLQAAPEPAVADPDLVRGLLRTRPDASATPPHRTPGGS